MGLLNAFRSKPDALLKLPPGSFTLDKEGRIIVSTLPSTFPQDLVRDIAQRVMTTFRSARTVHQPLSELIVEFPALRLTARELRGGAIVFLAPHGVLSQPAN
jgi:hypothetical protein